MGRTDRLLLVTALLAAALLGVPRQARSAETRVLSHVSRGELPDGSGFIGPAHVSADGSHVLFVTTGRLLGVDDEAPSYDIYDRSANGLRLVTYRPAFMPDQNTIGPYGEFVVSADGSRVMVLTDERLAPTDTDDQLDLYAFDGSSVEHVTENPLGADTAADVYSWQSPDARSFVVTGGESYVQGKGGPFLHTAGYGWKALSTGDQAIGAEPLVFSRTGVVAFGTQASLVPEDTDVVGLDVYTVDATGAVSLASPTPGGWQQWLDSAFLAGISANGDHVFYASAEPQTAADQNLSDDLYRTEPGGATPTLISAEPGVPRTTKGYESYCGASTDGETVAFVVGDPLLPSDTDSEADVYVRLPSGELVDASDGPLAAGHDGVTCVAGLSVSEDGSRVLLQTKDRLLASDTDSANDLYVRVVGGDLHQVSDGVGPDQEVDAVWAHSSRDGRRITFRTTERLTADDTDDFSDVYATGPDGSLSLISTGPRVGAAAPSDYIDASADGREVLFSTAERLARSDTDTSPDLYLSAISDPPTPQQSAPTTGAPSAPSAGPAPTSVVDRDPPRVSRVRFVGSGFPVGGPPPRLGRSIRGPHLGFELSEKARIHVGFERETKGSRNGGRCAPKPPRESGSRSCVLRSRVPGSITLDGVGPGSRQLGFSGVFANGRRLRPGRYRLVLRAVDAAGNVSRPSYASVVALPRR